MLITKRGIEEIAWEVLPEHVRYGQIDRLGWMDGWMDTDITVCMDSFYNLKKIHFNFIHQKQ